MKWLKHAVKLLGGDAETVGPHAEYHLALRAGAIRLDRQQQPPALWHGSQAVARDVPDDLTNLIFVGFVPDRLRRNLDVDHVRIPGFRAVPQQKRRVLHDFAEIEPCDGRLLGTSVGEERSDRVVQALGLSKDDVHELRLLLAERQLLPEDLDRSRHRGQRVANLVRDAGGHLPHRGEPLLQARVTLEPLDLGDVLECVEIPASTVRKADRRHHQADLEEAAIAGPVLEIDRQAARLNERGQPRSDAGRQLQHLGDVVPDGLLRRNADDGGGPAVEGQDAAFGVGCHQATQ